MNIIINLYTSAIVGNLLIKMDANGTIGGIDMTPPWTCKYNALWYSIKFGMHDVS